MRAAPRNSPRLCVRSAGAMRYFARCFVFSITALLGFPACAQDDWEVMRVYIQDDQSYIDQLVTDDYFFEPIAELEAKLREEARRRSAIDFPTDNLQASFGVARLANDRLLSDNMIWTVRGQEKQGGSASPLNLGKLNMSVSRVRALPSGAIQLTDEDFYDAAGNLILAPRSGEQTYAFGFTHLGLRSDQSISWTLEIPPAPVAQLLINMPAEKSLASSTALVEELTVEEAASMIEQFIDSGSANPSSVTEPGSRWWLVNHSGLREFSLVASTYRSRRLGYSVIANRVVANYSLQRSQGTVQVDAELNPTRSGAVVLLDIPKSVRVNSVRFRGSTIRYQIDDVEPSDLSRLRVEIDALPVRADLSIEGVFETKDESTQPLGTAPRTISLPAIGMPGVFAVQGQTNIVTAPGFVLLDAARLAPKDSDAGNSTVTAMAADQTDYAVRTPNQIRFNWSREQPNFQVRLGESLPNFYLETLTQLEIQEGWLSARLNGRLSGKRINSNEFELQIGNGWFIDALAVRGLPSSAAESADTTAAAERIVPKYRQLTDDEGSGLRIWWEGIPPTVAFEVEVLAHRPLPSGRSRFILRADRMLSAPNARQNDYYAIASGGSYVLKPNDALLQQQTSALELPQWMNVALNRTPAAWFLEGSQTSTPASTRPSRVQIPRVRFERVDASFIVNSLTSVDLSRRECESRLRIETLSGALSTVDIVVPPSIDSSAIQWRVISVDRQSSEEDVGEIQTSSRLDGSTIVSLDLPPFAGELILAGRYRCAASPEEPCEFFVPDVLRAAGRNTQIMLPQNARLVDHDADVEFPGTVSNESIVELARRFDIDADDSPKQLIRTEATSAGRFSVQQANFASGLAYAHQATATHRLYTHEIGRGTVQWQVEVLAATKIGVKIPAQCMVKRVLVGDEVISEGGTAANLAERFDLPVKTGRDQRIRVEYEYPASNRLGFRVYTLPEPELMIEVASFDRLIELPPGRMSLAEIVEPRMLGTLWDRLNPKSLWKLIHPSSVQGEMTDDGWRVYRRGLAGRHRMGDSVSRTITTVDSALVACGFLAAALLLLGLLRLLGPRTHVGWCIAGSIAAAATVVSPIWLLGGLQLLLLSLLVGYLFFMVIPLLAYRSSRRKESKRRSSAAANQQLARSGPAASALILLFTALHGSMAIASPQPPSTTGSDRSTSPPASSSAPTTASALRASTGASADRKIYGVLIPVDENMEVSGAYAYVPTELLRKLNGDRTTGNRDTQIRITAADYQLKVRSATLAETSQTVSLSVDLVIQSPSPMAVLNLAFNASELILEKAAIDGSEDTFGTNVEQEVTTGTVSIRPMASGRHNVRLDFAPITVVAEGKRYNFAAAIPPIACSTLRIVAESQLDFNIRSNGVPQRSMASTFARVGAVEQLDVSWTQRSRNALDWDTPTRAQSWVHVSGDGVLCAASVTLPGDVRAGDEVRIPIDPNWIPIGDDWGDASLLRTTSTGLGIQVIHTLRVNDMLSGTRPVIRILLAPRQSEPGNSLRVPFLQPSGDTSTERRLLWSNNANANWRLEGVAGWQALQDVNGQPPQPLSSSPNGVSGNQPGEVGPLSANPAQPIGPDATGFNPPTFNGIVTSLESTWAAALFEAAPLLSMEGTAASGAPQLRRLQENASLNSSFVTESTTLLLGEDSFRLQFTADISFPSVAVAPLCQVRCASDLTIENVTIDGDPIEHLTVVEGDQQIITLHPESTGELNPNLADRFQLGIEFSSATRLGVATPLPRPIVIAARPVESNYRVLASPSINCELVDDGVGFQSLQMTPDEIVQQLKVGVGVADLSTNYRDAVVLPTKVRMRRIAEVRTLETTMTLTQEDGRWQANLVARWPSLTQELPIILLDIPSELDERMNWMGVAHRSIPGGDPTRTLVSVVLESAADTASSNGAEQVPTMELQFPIESSRSATSLLLPEIEFLNMNRSSDRLVVPGAIDGKAISWTGVGKKIDDVSQPERLTYERLVDGSRIAWRSASLTQDAARVLLEDVRLDVHTQNEILGRMRAVVLPNGQFTIGVRTEEGCEIYGARVNGIPVKLSGQAAELSGQAGVQQELELLLRPNYLPANVELFVRWTTSTSNSQGAIKLPTFSAADLSTQRVVSVSPESLALKLPKNDDAGSLARITLGGWKNQLSVAWLRSTDAAGSKLSGISDDEIDAWLKQFAPTALGVDGGQVPLPSSGRGIASNQSSLSTDQVWEQLCERLGVLPPSVPASVNERARSQPSDSHYVVSGHSGPGPVELFLEPASEQLVGRSRQVIAGGLLLLLGALGVIITRRFGNTVLGRIQEYTYLYWGYLTILLFLILPTILPGMLFAVLTCIILVSELLHGWRKANATPRNI